MNSRYVAFTQQPYCCVPTCLQIVFYRRNLPLIEQTEMAYMLGLAVPEKDRQLYPNAKTEQPSSGWGTQIQNPNYSLAKAFDKLGLPLVVEFTLASQINSADDLKNKLRLVEDNIDVLVCFSYGVLWDTNYPGGHVCVFDRMEGDEIWLIDPEHNVPKHRKASMGKLFDAIQKHGDQNQAGLWFIRSK